MTTYKDLKLPSCDYRELFERYKDMPNVVFLVDPPYLSTEVGTYTMRWGLSDYLDVLTVLAGTTFIYFNVKQIVHRRAMRLDGQASGHGESFQGCPQDRVQCARQLWSVLHGHHVV